jgi:hypothetical protein
MSFKTGARNGRWVILIIAVLLTSSLLLIACSLTGLESSSVRVRAQDFQIIDSDQDIIPDSDEDANGNGVVDEGETDPNNPDTDGDGWGDYIEAKQPLMGGDPLNPNVIPSELDFSNIDLGQIKTLTLISTKHIGQGVCEKEELQIDRESVSCSYPLSGEANNSYFTGLDSYYAYIEGAEGRGSCYVENNETPEAKLVCAPVPALAVNEGEHKVILEKVPYEPGFSLPFQTTDIAATSKEVLNDKITIKTVAFNDPNGNQELRGAAEASLSIECAEAPVESTTTCVFKLPDNIILPADYKLSVDDKVGGDCTLNEQNDIVTCTEVPTGEVAGIRRIISTISDPVGNNVSLLMSGESYSKKFQSPLALSIETGQEIPVIKGLEGAIDNTSAELVFEDLINNQNFVIEGMIINGEFVPSDKVKFPDFGKEKVSALLRSSGVMVGGKVFAVRVDFNVKRPAQVSSAPATVSSSLSSSPQVSVSASSASAASLPVINTVRTGGQNIVNYIIAGTIIFAVVVLLVYLNQKGGDKKSKAVKNFTLSLFVLLTSGSLVMSILYPVLAQIAGGVITPQTFQSGSCTPSIIEYNAQTNCVFPLPGVAAGMEYRTKLVAFYQHSENSISSSEPCYIDSNKSNLICLGLAGLATGDYGVRLAFLDYNFAYASEYPSNNQSLTQSMPSGVLTRINVVEENSNASLSVGTVSREPFYYSGQKIYVAYYVNDSSIVGNRNVYLRITSANKSGISTSTIQAKKVDAAEYGTEFVTANPGTYSFTTCIGSSPDSCQLGGNTRSIKVSTPDASLQGLTGSERVNTDRINLVFSCSDQFDSVNDCRDKIFNALSIDGNPIPVNQGSLSTNGTATALRYGLFSIEPFKSNRDKFNLWIVNQLNPGGSNYLNLLMQKSGIDPVNAVYISVTDVFGLSNVVKRANRAARIEFNEQFGKDGRNVAQSLARNIAAAVGDLTYEEEGNITGMSLKNNCQPTAEAARTQWTAILGKDPNGQVDPFYSQWINDLKKYKHSSGSGTLFDSLPVSQKSEESHRIDMSKIKRAGGCMTSDEVYIPTTASLMRSGISPVLGAVSRAIVEKVLGRYKGASSAPVITTCSNGALNAPFCDDYVGSVSSYCPTGAVYNSQIGLCEDSGNVYGLFSRSMVDACDTITGRNKACRAVVSLDVAGRKVNLLRYNKGVANKILANRKNKCMPGVGLDTKYTNYCMERSTQSLSGKKEIYVPFSKDIINRCMKAGGGVKCFTNRLEYDFFDKIMSAK